MAWWWTQPAKQRPDFILINYRKVLIQCFFKFPKVLIQRNFSLFPLVMRLEGFCLASFCIFFFFFFWCVGGLHRPSHGSTPFQVYFFLALYFVCFFFCRNASVIRFEFWTEKIICVIIWEIFSYLSSLPLHDDWESPSAIFDLWMSCPQGSTRARIRLIDLRPLDALPARVHQSSHLINKFSASRCLAQKGPSEVASA